MNKLADVVVSAKRDRDALQALIARMPLEDIVDITMDTLESRGNLRAYPMQVLVRRAIDATCKLLDFDLDFNADRNRQWSLPLKGERKL